MCGWVLYYDRPGSNSISAKIFWHSRFSWIWQLFLVKRLISQFGDVFTLRNLFCNFTPNWNFLNLLFFDAYVICKKNYSFSRVVFFQTKMANSLYSKINESSRVRKTRFSSSRSRFGVWVTVVPNIFTIYS